MEEEARVERTHQVFTLAVGALLATGAAWFGFGAARDALRFPDAPIEMTAEQAALTAADGRQWVTVREAAWRCADAVPTGVYQLVPATTPEGALLVARTEAARGCAAVAAAPMTGIVEDLEREHAARLEAAGVLTHHERGAYQLTVCTDCGRGNARLGVVVCALIMALGVFLGPLSTAVGRWRAGMHADLDSAARAPAHSEQANDRVRLHGFVTAALGGLCLVVGRGWLVWGLIPAPWLGGAVALLGAFMLTFPERYRSLRRR
jgi:hypothetical protein